MSAPPEKDPRGKQHQQRWQSAAHGVGGSGIGGGKGVNGSLPAAAAIMGSLSNPHRYDRVIN